MRRDPVAMTIDKLKLNEGLITLLLRQVLDLSPVSLCHSGVTLSLWCHSVSPSITHTSMMSLVTCTTAMMTCWLSVYVLSTSRDCSDPYDSGGEGEGEGNPPKPTKVDIDLELTAFANARRYSVPLPSPPCCAPPTTLLCPSHHRPVVPLPPPCCAPPTTLCAPPITALLCPSHHPLCPSHHCPVVPLPPPCCAPPQLCYAPPSCRYYHHKLHAAEKEKRTIQASAQVCYLATTSGCITFAQPLAPPPAPSGP